MRRIILDDVAVEQVTEYVMVELDMKSPSFEEKDTMKNMVCMAICFYFMELMDRQEKKVLQ